MEGAVIGTYRVSRKLGEGGMGAVYLAEHALLGRKAAIKVLQPTLSANQDIVQRFFNEARAATAIADPGIVQIFDFGYHTDGSAYIVMEFLEGEPLDGRLKRFGRLSAPDALRILRQVASSLAAAHARGIIHRDLKPENVFLVSDREVAGGERPKLLDFGIAKLTGDTASKVKTHTAAIMGTPLYMSPEQCRGAGHVDLRSDIYSLGCVLFHLLVGKPPFDGEGVGEIIACHLREPAPLPSAYVPDVPPEVDGLVARCMAKSPDERFQSASELADHIGWLLGQGGQPHPASMSGRISGSMPGYTPGSGALTPTTLSGAVGVRTGPSGFGTGPGGYGTGPGGPGPGTGPGAVVGTGPGQLGHAAGHAMGSMSPAGSQVALGTGVAPVGRSKLGLLVGAGGLAIAAIVVIAVVATGGSKSAARDSGTQPTTMESTDPTVTPVDEAAARKAAAEAALIEDAADRRRAAEEAAARATAEKLAAEQAAEQAAAKAAAEQAAAEKAEAERIAAERAAARARREGRRGHRTDSGGSSGTAAGSGSAKPTGSGVPGDKDGDGIPDER